MKTFWCALFMLTIAYPATSFAVAPSPSPTRRLSKEGIDFFEQKIRPVLIHHCYECHSGDPQKAKGHFVLDTREGLHKGGDSGSVINPRHPNESLLIEAIRYEELEMPPKEKLSDEVIADFVRWVEIGAPDPRVGKGARPHNKIDMAEGRKFWSFQSPKASSPPQVTDAAWPRTDIDRFVLARLEKEQLRPVADADRVTLIRRVTFDLTGLPPTPEEIDAFVNDTSPTAYAIVVNRLLASPHFGERWGRHWLDVVRYGESTGKERNVPYRFAWRYRDYVIDAFNHNMPYDRFIFEQLAGDLLPSKTERTGEEKDRLLVATGFLAIGPKSVNAASFARFRMDEVDDQIDVTTRAFLGITVACARCHDHKFDPIPTADYYAMAGIFRSTQTHSGIALNTKVALDERLLTLADATQRTDVSAQAAKDERARVQEIAQVERQIADLRNPPAPKKGAANGKGKGPLTVYPKKTDQKTVREQIKELEDHLEDLRAVPSPYHNLAMGVADADKPDNCRVLKRGELDDPGAEVPRGVLTVIKTEEASQIPPRHSGRLELARWIASTENPLTARVMVNRVWEHLFGQGLVDTVDNFGVLGDEPSHPELLDTLAVQFMHDKWLVKKLIRSIVMSRVYQLGNEYRSENFEKDPANRLLWRRDRRRLDAEEIRDAMLAAAGQLQLERPAGSVVMDMSNKQFFGLRAVHQASDARSVYLPILRNAIPETLQAFDMADPSLIVGKRDVTTVPTQALYMMNNPFVLAQADHLAKRVLTQANLDRTQRITLAYRLTLGRPPSETEIATVVAFLNDYRRALEGQSGPVTPQFADWSSFCQTLFASGAFRYIY